MTGLQLIIALAAFLVVGCQSTPSPPPNVLFILVDDLGWADVGFNNPDSFYDTPNLDRLATMSVRFTNAYAAAPVCSPTRASILTGKYPARLAATDYFGAPQPDEVGNQWSKPLLPATYEDRMPLEETTLAEALQAGGYATFFAGKWHLGPEGFWPEDQGFDVNRGGITGGGPYGGDRYFSPYGNPRLEDGPAGEHLPDRLATETISFIEDTAEQRFFAYLSFYSVHTPLMARPDLEAKYAARQDSVPPTEWGTEGERRVRLVQNHAIYAGMVEAMDQAVGRVLDHLTERDLIDNTVIVFMSDNGGLSTSEGHPTSNLPLRAGKGWLYEGGIREPMLVRWPGVTNPGTTIGSPVTSTDFYPTILAMAGLPAMPNQHVDGVSLEPLLRGNAPGAERPLFWHYPHYGNQGGSPGAAVRLGRYKLVEFYEDGRTELYDLEEDWSESRDLAVSLPEIREELLGRLHAWQASAGARFPTRNPSADLNGGVGRGDTGPKKDPEHLPTDRLGRNSLK
ncbi:MAG: arylsulfatase A-like enzyme [Rhodothermales bacterium]|jgi:arylsulfatase A-like enzyme